jgi:endogenous inhibitor of DNA gyrase (YacG/DUF329 family)
MVERKDKKADEKPVRSCPYCDEEVMEAEFPFCQLCGVNILYCPECHKPVSRESKVCPECGAEIRD